MSTDMPARLASPVPAPLGSRRPPQWPRTIPEQIADHLGMAILRGDYRAGERIGEQEMAELYGVSRGPVREAIRVLQARGMVMFEPRRGAFAIDISLDLIADLFNTRAALLGMAGRCFTRVAPARGLEQMAERLERLRAMAPMDASDPTEFTLEVGRIGASIYNHCDNAPLRRMLREQGETSLWGFIWHERPLDYFTPKRRAACIADYTATDAAARVGNEAEAEARLRKIIFDSRDSVLKTLIEVRGGTVDSRKILR